MTQTHATLNASTAAATTVDAEEIYQLVKRGDVNPHEVEVVGAHAVEVTVLWKSSILHVAHLDGTRSFVLATREGERAPAGRALLSGLAGGSTLIAASAATGSYALGAVGTLLALAGAGAGIAMDQRNVQRERDATRFVVAEEMLGGAESAEVVVNDARGTRFVFAASAQGHVEIQGVRRSLAELVASGEAKPAARGGKEVYEVAVREGGRYRMEIGGLTVTARQVAPGRAVSGRVRRDPALVWAGAGALASVAALVGASLFATSGGNGYLAQGADDDQLSALRDYVAQVHERQTPPEQGEQQGMAAPSDSGQRSRGEEGQAGDRTATQTHHRGAVRDNGQPPHLANQRGDASQLVADRGIFAAVPAPSAGGSMIAPWSGATTESGHDSSSVNGGLDGPVGASLGWGGLGDVGTGVGGGGTLDGMVGVGVLGTVGRRGTGGPGIGEGVGHHLTDRASGPIAVPGPVQTAGDGISREAVRRVVLRNLGQVAHCHEQGLAQNPALAGRVVVRFVIGPTGVVTGANVAQSTVPVASVGTCIASAVRRWPFPAPSNGQVVSVTYPFTLQPPVQ